VHAISSPSLSIPKLAKGFTAATAGRHIMVWSAAPGPQAVWTAAGASGALTPDSVLVAVINRAGNKLDQFLDVRVDGTTRVTGDATTVTLKITLRNRTPDGEAPYIIGFEPEVSGVPPGDYGGLLTADVPQYAGGISLQGAPSTSVAGTDGDSDVIGGPVRIRRGGQSELTVTFGVQGAHGRLRIAPSGRLPSVGWTFDGITFSDDVVHTVSW
jgi:hypothetical protein